MKYGKNEDSDIAFCGTYQVSEKEKYSRAITEEQVKLLNQDFRTLFLGNYIGAPSATIVRNKKICMDEKLVWYVDVEWYLNILRHNPKFVFTKKPLISIGISETQVTNDCLSDPELSVKESIYLYKKYIFLQEKEYAEKVIEEMDYCFRMREMLDWCKEKRIYIYGAGVAGKRCCRFLMKNNIALEGFVVSEGRKETEWLAGYPVFETGGMKRELDQNSGIILAIKNEEEALSVLDHLHEMKIDDVFRI